MLLPKQLNADETFNALSLHYQYKDHKEKKFIKKKSQKVRVKRGKSNNTMFLKKLTIFAVGYFSLIQAQERFTSSFVSSNPQHVRCLLRHNWIYRTLERNTQDYCSNVSITWRLQQAYSSRDQADPGRAFSVYWSVPSLREGLREAWGSLIKLTLKSDTRGWGSSTEALGRHYELFFLCPRLDSHRHIKWQGCEWVTSAYNA